MPDPLVIIVASDDLLFATRLAAAVGACGHRAVVAHTAAALRDALGAGPAGVILNLAASRFDAVAALRETRTDPATRAVPFLGFCGHADAARRESARAAGCDLLATNGEISANLPRLLTALLQRSPAATPQP